MPHFVKQNVKKHESLQGIARPIYDCNFGSLSTLYDCPSQPKLPDVIFADNARDAPGR